MSIDLQGFAQSGFKEITGTTEGDFVAIQSDGGPATYSAVTQDGDNLSSADRSEGVTVYGKFTKIAVTSGKVLGYLRIPKG